MAACPWLFWPMLQHAFIGIQALGTSATLAMNEIVCLSFNWLSVQLWQDVDAAARVARTGWQQSRDIWCSCSGTELA